MHGPSPDLWAARLPGQVFAVEQHAKAIRNDPGLAFTALIPEMDHFKGSEGGRVLPLLHPDGSPDVAPGLTAALGSLLDVDVNARDLLAYVAALVAHPAFTARFTDELTTPGIRVSLTLDPELWQQAVALGKQVLWLHTYGAAYADPDEGRPVGNIRLPADDSRQPRSLTPVTAMPTAMTYHEDAETLALGDGEWAPVTPQVAGYTVGGRNVLTSWFNYRKATPTGKKTSPLDKIHLDAWPTEWSIELIDLLAVLTRLAALEPEQAELLDRILAGPLGDTGKLGEHGVRWPRNRRDRTPRYPLSGDDARSHPDAAQLPIDA